jgi:hypothetical protein
MKKILLIIIHSSKVQLKNLTHMFCLPISSYKVYKKDVFFNVFTLKTMCHLGWTQRSLTLKAKHKMKKQCLHG